MLGFNAILVAVCAIAIMGQKAVLRESSHGKTDLPKRSLAGLSTAAVLGSVWWNVVTYGQASIWLALPFLYGAILALLAHALWTACARSSSRPYAFLPEGEQRLVAE